METYPQTRWTLTALLEAPRGEPSCLLLQLYFPQWVNAVEYWHVPDLDALNAEKALALMERDVKNLVQELADDKSWDEQFANSQDKLAKWGKKVRADIQAGRFKEIDWDEL